MKKQNVFKWIILVVALLFAVVNTGRADVRAATKTTKSKASYTIKKYTQKYGKGKRITGLYEYQLPQLKGSTKTVKKINAALKKGYTRSLKDKKSLAGYVKADNDNPYRTGSGEYFYKTVCKATYNKRGYVSFRFHHDWFAGGVHNGWTDGMTFDLRTGKKLSVANVIAGNSDTVKRKIINRYFDKYPEKRANSGAWRELNDTKISDFQFYLKNGYVVVGFGPYQPGGGNGESRIVFKGSY